MKNKFTLFTLFISLFTVTPAFSQVLRGSVTDETSQSMDYFKIEILNPADSSVLKTGIFVNGAFTFDKLLDKQYLIRISSMGYQDVIKSINLFEKTNWAFQLKPSEVKLQEIVVNAKMPTVINKDNRYVIEIEKT